jgi:hypothetical protein
MKKTISLLSLLVTLAIAVHAQHLNKEQVRDLVNSRHFTFKAQSVIPMGAPSRILTSDYDLRVHGDSLISYLPYFGRSYTAPLPNEAGMNFTSTDYTLTTKERKKNRLEITMLPKDTRLASELILTVYENGTAQLTVNSNEKQSIRYSGYIRG